MAKKRRVRKHTANAHVQVLGLSKAGTSIDVDLFADEEKLGKLVIGRGSLTWYGNKWKTGRRFSWSRFAECMDSRVIP
jgi:hypothetical protein